MSTHTNILPLSHQDLLTSLAFNYYGDRLLTTSADHTIRISSLDSSTGTWSEDESGSFKAHDGVVNKAVWAHPEFGGGGVIASAGMDGSVRVWEEVNDPHVTVTQRQRWQRRACLVDAQGSVRDLAFAPPEFGLKLASISADSHLRVYECLDVAGLSDWSLVDDIDLASLPKDLSPSSSSSFRTPFHQASASAISFNNNPASSVKGFENSSRFSIPSLGGGSTNPAPSAAGSSSSGGKSGPVGSIESDGGWTLSWCKECWWGEVLAVCAGPVGVIRLFHLSPNSHWTNFLNLAPPTSQAQPNAQPFGQTNPISSSTTSRAASVAPTASGSATSGMGTPAAPICSIDWAPGSGRDYQLIASGSRDGMVRIWKVSPPEVRLGDGDQGMGAGLQEEQQQQPDWKWELSAELDSHAAGGGVGRVEWNITGTVLSTAGDDGTVRLWKPMYAGTWMCVSVVTCEEGPASSGYDGGKKGRNAVGSNGRMQVDGDR